MLRFVILSFAFLLTFSASAASPEILVGRSEPAPAPQQRAEPAVASDGDGFFVVWEDERSGTGAVLGTRITRDGRVLDPFGLRISSPTLYVHQPRVAWDGEAYLVVWAQSETLFYERDLYAARIAPNGAMLMVPRLVVEDVFTDGSYLASNGTVSVIAYVDSISNGRIVVLDQEGNTTHDEVIASDSEYKRDFAIAAGTSRFVVAWAENEGFDPDSDVVKAVTVTAAGHAIGTPAKIQNGDLPAIATDGTYFQVVSRTSNSWIEQHLRTRRYDGNLQPAGDEHMLLESRQFDHTNVLWLGGNRYEVLATRGNAGISEIVSIEIDNGTPREPRGRGQVGETLFLRHVAATNGSDVIVARAAYSGTGYRVPQIFSQLYPGNRTNPTVPSLLSWSGNAHRRSDIASSPHGHIAAWTEDDGTFATRIDRNGNSLDGRGMSFGTFAGGFVRVAFDGTNYVVAWRGNPYVSVRWISPLTGATVAETQIPEISWPEFALAVSPDALYVVLSRGDVQVVRIPHATHTPDPVPLAVTQGPEIADHPAAAWNGSALLVTWNEMYYNDRGDPPIYYPIKVYAARVTAGLTLLDPSPILVAEGEIHNEEGDTWQDPVDQPSVATNGTGWLVVTSHRHEEILARRVLQSGMLEGTGPVKIGDGHSPVVAWDGTRYTVAWKTAEYFATSSPIVMSAVAPAGPLAPGPLVLVTDRTASSRPAIASHGAGASVAYTKVSYLPEHAGVERTFFRVMELGSPRGRVVRR